jgi:hypothetical protein
MSSPSQEKDLYSLAILCRVFPSVSVLPVTAETGNCHRWSFCLLLGWQAALACVSN